MCSFLLFPPFMENHTTTIMSELNKELADFLIKDDDAASECDNDFEADGATPLQDAEEESALISEEEEGNLEETEPGSEAGPESRPSDMAPVLEKLDVLRERLDSLGQEFVRKLRYDASKQEIIDRQYHELEYFRREESAKLSRAVMMDVIEEVDSAEKNGRYYEDLEASPENFAKLKKLVLHYSEDLRDLLERNGLASYRTPEGTPFNPKRCRILKTVPTSDLSLNKSVCKSLRWGFENEEKIIRPELVTVYVYEESRPAEPEGHADNAISH